jgi:hypothetical protein
MLEAPATEVVMINGPFEDFEESLGKFGAGCLSKMDGYVGGTSVGDLEESISRFMRFWPREELCGMYPSLEQHEARTYNSTVQSIIRQPQTTS